MLVFEYKVKGKAEQYAKVDEAVCTGQFIRNYCLTYCQQEQGTIKKSLQKHYAALATNSEFPWAKKLYGRSIRANTLSINRMSLYRNASPM